MAILNRLWSNIMFHSIIHYHINHNPRKKSNNKQNEEYLYFFVLSGPNKAKPNNTY